MQLNDILEENSIKAISTKTKISEDNLENLLAKNFDKLKKVKTLGFISIIEREYNADLSDLREEGHEYYSQSGEDQSITLGLPITEDKKGSSKFFMFFILLLFGAATWYFLTQFDKKNLSELIPFMDEATLENIMGNDDSVDVVANLKISKVSEANSEETISSMQSETITDDRSVVVAQTVTDITPEMTETSVESMEAPMESTTEALESEPIETMKKIISIVPTNRLWFGIIDMETKERNHFSISKDYALEVGTKKWLVATSSAPFSLKAGEKSEEFNDAKEHYFIINQNGVKSLDKSEYVALGGWAQW